MVNILMIVIGTLIVSIIGGGLGYLIWVKSRPKKITWKAKIYTLGEGVRKPERDKYGNIVSDIDLRDLRPYGKDLLQRVEKQHGLVIYRLLRLNAPTNEPTSNCVDYWGPEDKEVNVLKDGDSYTVLNKGFDIKTSEIVFQPLSYETSTMLMNQAELRKDKLKKEKDVLAQITPWVVVGMSLLFLFGVFWLAIQGMTEMNERNAVAMEAGAQAQIEAANIFNDGIMLYKGLDPNNKNNDLGRQNQEPIPSIE